MQRDETARYTVDRWILATAAPGRRRRPHLWAQTVAEGVVWFPQGKVPGGAFIFSISILSLFGVASHAHT